MSHFTVLVIGENPEEQLAPFQENNMGDCPKEYLKYRYDGEYYESEEAARAAIGDGFDPKENGYWENPNKKWDWYSLGGRWTGYFKLKSGVLEVVGDPGLMTPAAESGYGDQCLKRDIDFESMRNDAGKKAQDKYELAMTFIGEIPSNESWDSVRGRFEKIDEAREYYWNQARCVAWKQAEKDNFRNDSWPFGFMESPDQFLVSKEDYIENARNSAISSFAVIKDGKWYERGEMGWWGMVSNEKADESWNTEFTKLIDGLPDDILLSVYDCHI